MCMLYMYVYERTFVYVNLELCWRPDNDVDRVTYPADSRLISRKTYITL